MILDLGRSMGNALQNLFNKPVTDTVIKDTIKDVCVLLIQHNVHPEHVAKLREKIMKTIEESKFEANVNKAKLVKKAVYEEIVSMLTPSKTGYKVTRGKTNVIVFVGLQGCGKTTSICRYANYYKKKQFRVGIVCADTFRAGAYDQIKQNATKIGVPYFGSDNPDPVEVAKRGVAKFRREDFELILVDTSGRHTQEEQLFEEMRVLVAGVRPDNILFVMDAGIGQSAEEQARGFQNAVGVGGIILTKLDGAEKSGGALSSVAATDCSIEFVGTGEGMDDFEKFDGRRFVSKMLGMGDLDGLMEAVAGIKVDEKEMVEKLSAGKFSLADFRNVFVQLMSIGPLSKLLGMIPGMQGIELPDERKFKRIKYVFDSFSKEELNSNGDLFIKQPSRVRRVARGSGVAEAHVTELIVDFKRMSSAMRKMMANPMFSQMLGSMSDGNTTKSFDQFINTLM